MEAIGGPIAGPASLAVRMGRIGHWCDRNARMARVSSRAGRP